jgi:hypothetical protein
MVDEPEKVSLELLGKLMRGLVSDVAEIKAVQAKDHAAIENMDATLTRMHADVVDAKATGKEVAVRLTLVEHRMGVMNERLDRIERHVGPVDA